MSLRFPIIFRDWHNSWRQRRDLLLGNASTPRPRRTGSPGTSGIQIFGRFVQGKVRRNVRVHNEPMLRNRRLRYVRTTLTAASAHNPTRWLIPPHRYKRADATPRPRFALAGQRLRQSSAVTSPSTTGQSPHVLLYASPITANDFAARAPSRQRSARLDSSSHFLGHHAGDFGRCGGATGRDFHHPEHDDALSIETEQGSLSRQRKPAAKHLVPFGPVLALPP